MFFDEAENKLFDNKVKGDTFSHKHIRHAFLNTKVVILLDPNNLKGGFRKRNNFKDFLLRKLKKLAF